MEARNKTGQVAKEILEEASDLVTGSRADAYGDMVGCHQQIADLWNAFLSDKLKEALGAQDVAMLMALLKIARLRVSPEHRDSVIDLAGYTAIYGAITNRFHND